MPDQLRAIPYSVRPVSPGQWFIVSETAIPQDALRGMLESLAPEAVGIDQSHGRVRIAISGPTVERTLAKGTGVDLALSTFPIGHATTTLFGHIAAHLTRIDETSFELIVLRGFAESLWDDLLRMSLTA
ncbi:sarcosine oxidase subunit gamma family protein [Bradyrhizobium sp. B097]|uniref:sarcosine oxidase subunit gamma family protein n=1 Tax=Bradyrhizobium sp. B097 TaxID=3140244 RepID=UPI0031837AA8